MQPADYEFAWSDRCRRGTAALPVINSERSFIILLFVRGAVRIDSGSATGMR